MARVSGSVPNLISGISQQAPTLRLASQAEDQVNAWPSVVDGLDKRPGSEHLARLHSGAVPDTAFMHTINRDPTERYVISVFDGDLKVHSISGAEQVVAFPHGKGYLAGTSFSAVSVVDYTFIVNRDVVVAMDATPAPGLGGAKTGLVAVRAASPGVTYYVTVWPAAGGAWSASYTVPSGASDTVAVAQAIGAALSAASAGGITYTTTGSTLQLFLATGGDFRLATADSVADQYITPLKDVVQSAAVLPRQAPNGFVLEIQGAIGNANDNYFVRYDAAALADGSGIWREVAKPGRQFRFNAATMPHLLVREADGSFTFRRAEWGECRAGDENTIPTPGLVGSAISDVFFYRNRLGFIGRDNVLMSRDSEYFNFWRRSATQLVDSDPIDVTVSGESGSGLKRAVPFNEALLFFTAKSQFAVSPVEVLSPSTIDIPEVTAFEADVEATRPLGLGSNVFFPAFRGGNTAIREFYVTGQTRKADSNDITQNVPKLLKGGVQDMAVSSIESVVAVVTAGQRNVVAVYKFLDEDDQRIVQGWGRWVFPDGDRVLSIEFIGSTLYLGIARADGLYLERIDVSPGLTAGDLDCFPKLDRAFVGTNNGGVTINSDGTQTVTLPFPVSDPLQAVVIEDTGEFRAGEVLAATSTPTTITLPSTAELGKVVIGLPFTMRHVFSPFFIRDTAPGGGQQAVNNGRLQVVSVKVSFTETTFFRVEVTPLRRPTYSTAFAGRVLGSARNLLGTLPRETGDFTFSVRSAARDTTIALVNDSPWPSRFLSAEWEGLYTPRTKRLG